MGITKLDNQNLNNDASDGEINTDAVDSSKIGAEIKNEDISPTANIPASKLALPGTPSQFVRGDGSFGTIDTTGIDENAFNIGVLGFKMAVNDGLTIFNLKDGVVDEFHDESGIDMKILMQLMTLLQISIQMMHQMTDTISTNR